MNGRLLRFLTRTHAPTKSHFAKRFPCAKKNILYQATRDGQQQKQPKTHQTFVATTTTTMMMMTVVCRLLDVTVTLFSFDESARPVTPIFPTYARASGGKKATRASGGKRLRARNNDSHTTRDGVARAASWCTIKTHYTIFLFVCLFLSLYFFFTLSPVRLSRDHADVENRHHTPHSFLLAVDTGTFRVHRQSIL